MRDSKVLLVIQSFSKSELREFGKFAASPYFNQKQDVVKMYEILKKAAPEFAEKKINRTAVMKQIFPNEHFDEKQYKYLSNLLLKLTEQYISLKETESRPMIQEYHLLSAYVKRNIDKNFNFIYNKTNSTQKDSPRKDANFYYREYLLKNVAAEHFDKKKVRKNNEYLEELISSLDLYYLANKLKYSCHLLNNRKIFPKGRNPYLPKEILALLSNNDFSPYPAIHIYFTLYKLVTEEKENDFNEIKELLINYQDFFETEELKEIYYFVINYCVHQLIKNNKTSYYLQELYDIYQEGIDTELLLEDGFLSPWTYKNVIKIGFRLKKFQETEQFIKQKKEQLKPEFQSDAYNYNLAELFYRKREYDDAFSHLNNVNYSDIYYILDSKKLLCKIYFETEEDEALDSLLLSFQTYLKRNKIISDENRKSYLNFTKLLLKITKDDFKKTDFSKTIENTNPLTDKNWLLEIAKK